MRLHQLNFMNAMCYTNEYLEYKCLDQSHKLSNNSMKSMISNRITGSMLTKLLIEWR